MLNNTKAFSFLGITSQQQFADLISWELFFQRCGKIASLTELGTGRGGMSLYFMLMALQKGFQFFTYDIEPPFAMGSRIARMLDLKANFTKLDVFANIPIVIRRFSHPLVLFCDDGDKDKEVFEYHKYLLQGDYLAVHDYGREIFEDDIPKIKFEPFMLGECLTLESITRFYKVL